MTNFNGRLASALRAATASSAKSWFALALFVPWLVVVATAMRHHEFQRDEVRALSLALQADHLWTVPAAVHGEGHPSLWFVLLRLAFDITHSKKVLPAVSLVVAAAAVLFFLWEAPFPLWLKALFVFSLGPVYHFSVMARNYGISMLLMFLIASAFASPRPRPIRSGVLLLLLAQTNVMSALLVPLYCLLWVWRWWTRRDDVSGREPASLMVAGIAIAFAGILAAFFTVYPTHLDLVVRGPHTPVTTALRYALTNPGHNLLGLVEWTPRAATITVWLVAFGLIFRPPLLLAAMAGLWELVVFFECVYPAEFRHSAMWLIFVITLYWLCLAEPKSTRPSRMATFRTIAFYTSAFAVLPALLAMQCKYGRDALRTDRDCELSSMGEVGTFLQSSGTMRRAIVIAEPEHIGEPLPYYADNDIFLVREGKFGKIATWSTHSIIELTLAQVLHSARDLAARTGRPVAILMLHDLADAGAGKRIDAGGYGWGFSYSADDIREFRKSTRLAGSFRRSITDENADLYLLDPPAR